MNEAKFNNGLFPFDDFHGTDDNTSSLPAADVAGNEAPYSSMSPDEFERSISGRNDGDDAENDNGSKNNRRISLVKLVAITLVVVFAILFSTFSWFTMNRETENNGMAMTATDLPFEIATIGNAVRNDSLLESVRTEYVDGTVSGNYHITSGTESIKLRYDTSLSDSAEVRPGIGDTLRLYIVPKTNSAVDVRITLNISAFVSVSKMDQNGNILYKTENGQQVLDTNGNPIVDTELIEVTNAADFASEVRSKTNNNGVAADASNYVKAADYLRGHILFFGGEGDTSESTPEAQRYYYTTPYTSGVIDAAIPANKLNTPVPVPIYWMWINTLGQIALPDNSSQQRRGYPILADSNTDDKAIIKTYLIDNRANIFANNDSNTVDYINAVTSTNTTPETFSTAFSALSKGYNRADNYIGTRIAYFIIEVTIEQG